VAQTGVSARTGINAGVRLAPTWLVIDYDLRRGKTGGEWKRFCAKFKIDPQQFPTVKTGSGGLHLFMRAPKDCSVSDTLEEFDSIEFKSKGRQMVAAGSIHPNGNLYRWLDYCPALKDAPKAPAALIDAIRKPERGEAIGGGQFDQEHIAAALAGLDPTKFSEHDAWLKLMMAVHAASNGDAREEFITWSVGDSTYADDAEVIGWRWDSLKVDGGITYKSLNAILIDAGRPDLTVAVDDAADDFEGEALPNDADNFEGEEPSEWEFLEGEVAPHSTATDLMRVEARGLRLNPKTNIAPDDISNAYSAIHNSGLSPAWDELKQNIVLRAGELPWDAETFGRVLSDHLIRLIRLYCIGKWQGVQYQPCEQNLRDALATIGYRYKFNPVLEYLDALKWDGKSRVDHLFGKYFNCGDDAYTRAVSRCFAIGAVRRMRKPGSKFDTAPILKSPQGWNKSTGIKKLFGAEWYSDADLGNLRDNDSAMKLRGIWVQEFAEIESLSRAEVGVLKAFMSRATDRQRDPYGHIVTEGPRRSVFVGTVNEGGYLKDSTGARRFWPLEVTAPIDLALIDADRDQIWAEASALEAQGASDVLPENLWSMAAERQSGQTTADPWADILRPFLDQRTAEFDRLTSSDEGDELIPALPPDRVHSAELFDALAIKSADQSKDKAQRLRTVMEQSLGWHHRHSVRVAKRASAGYVRERLAVKVKR
jgi:hypothetical protein